MSFRLVPKSVTLNDLERRNGRIVCVISPNSVALEPYYVKVVEDQARVGYRPEVWRPLANEYEKAQVDYDDRLTPEILQATCSVECYQHCSDETVHYKCDETVNFCGFGCATKSPITVFINAVFFTFITGWAVALTCCISHIVKYRKKADFDSSGSQNRLTNFDETWHG